LIRGAWQLFGRLFHFDRGYRSWMACGLQWFGVGVFVAWGISIFVHFFEHGELGTLLLGLVVLLFWIPLWRILFAILASMYRWR
jgi:hypothetical protein